MKLVGNFYSLLLLSFVFTTMVGYSGLRSKDLDNEVPMSNSSSADSDEAMATSDLSAEGEELMKAKEALKAEESVPAPKSTKGKFRAEAFVAGADWEFDGFVAGGQDQNVKSMFATNDLVYLNIGSDQGLKAGERLGLYRRGDKIRDPQTGRVLGFEVRKLAVGEVTDLIDANSCSVRVVYANEAIEIGDLVRKE